MYKKILLIVAMFAAMFSVPALAISYMQPAESFIADTHESVPIVLMVSDIAPEQLTQLFLQPSGLSEPTVTAVTEQSGGAVLAYSDDYAINLVIDYHGPTETKLTLDAGAGAVDTSPQLASAVPFVCRC